MGAAAAPPPTRGWTRIERGRPLPIGGSPAHAGMDPGGAPAGGSSAGLPRPRGDGPLLGLLGKPDPAAPPPTRGWTRRPALRPPGPGGSPAHAGMDPSCRSSSSACAWLPRPRGDGPSRRMFSRRSCPAPPPTRGWTRARCGTDQDRPGSPAHAGMDPLGPVSPRPEDRLPRPRGDGPHAIQSLLFARSAPPPTRGWTRHARSDRGSCRGSPAHAGMDPRRFAGRSACSGLPRPRGDGPVLFPHLRKGEGAPPPTRGWTPRASYSSSVIVGSPAHAGMDPGRRRSRRTG